MQTAGHERHARDLAGRSQENGSAAVAAPLVAGHTPGPWLARAGIGRWNVVTATTPRSFNICSINTDRTEQAENAQLLAAAPELLWRLKEALDALESLPELPQGREHRIINICQRARAAIAKAST